MHTYIAPDMDYKVPVSQKIAKWGSYNKMAARMAQKGLRRVIFMTFIIGLMSPSIVCLASRDGEPVNVVPFGEFKKWDSQGKDYGVIWEDARDIFRVVVRFADSGTIPETSSLRLEYWQSSWPHRRIPRDKLSGAGSSGWLNVGDWFQGKWLKADTNLQVKGTTYTFTFNPVNAKEFPGLKGFSARYRSTLKLRVVADRNGEGPHKSNAKSGMDDSKFSMA
jgi:hypothetical protein